MSTNDAVIIDTIKGCLEKNQAVALAFLFGSRANKNTRNVSDWDIGVYLKPDARREETETRMWSELADIVNGDVDLIVLNEAPPLLAYRVITSGIPLKIEDRNLYLDFLLRSSYDADFFLNFSHDYYLIYQRSASLNEIDRARLEKIIIFLENELKDFDGFKKMGFEEYSTNVSRKREIERWVETIINGVLDISKIILASEKKILPDTYKKLISEISLVSGFGFCTEMETWVELRNILAHEYLDILWNKISRFLKNAYPVLDKFLVQTKSYLGLTEETRDAMNL